MRSILIFIFMRIFPSIALAGDASARKSSELFAWPIYHNPFERCSGTCTVSIYGGRFLETSLLNVSRANTFSASSNWKDSGLVAATFSRKLVENPDWWSIEAELGGGEALRRTRFSRELDCILFSLVRVPLEQNDSDIHRFIDRSELCVVKR